MSLRQIDRCLRVVCTITCVAMCLMALRPALAAEYHGRVTFGGLPVPGATITATQGSKKVVAVSDQQGSYSFADLVDGTWEIQVEMQCFSTIEQTVTIAPNVPSGIWELKLLSLDQIMAKAKEVKPETKPVLTAQSDAAPGKGKPPKPEDSNAAAKAPEEPAPAPSDGLLINGTPLFSERSECAQAAVQQVYVSRDPGRPATHSPPASPWAEYVHRLPVDPQRRCHDIDGTGPDRRGADWRSTLRRYHPGHAGAGSVEAISIAKRL